MLCVTSQANVSIRQDARRGCREGQRTDVALRTRSRTRQTLQRTQASYGSHRHGPEDERCGQTRPAPLEPGASAPLPRGPFGQKPRARVAAALPQHAPAPLLGRPTAEAKLCPSSRSVACSKTQTEFIATVTSGISSQRTAIGIFCRRHFLVYLVLGDLSVLRERLHPLLRDFPQPSRVHCQPRVCHYSFLPSFLLL